MQSIIHFFTILVFCVPHYHFIALIQHALINESWKQKVKCLSSDTEDHILIHSDICVLSWSGKLIVAPVASIGRLSSVQLNSWLASETGNWFSEQQLSSSAARAQTDNSGTDSSETDSSETDSSEETAVKQTALEQTTVEETSVKLKNLLIACAQTILGPVILCQPPQSLRPKTFKGACLHMVKYWIT